MSAARVLDIPPRQVGRQGATQTNDPWCNLLLGFWQQVELDLRYGWMVLTLNRYRGPTIATYGLDAFWWLYQPDFEDWCDRMPTEIDPDAYRRAMLRHWPGEPLPPRPLPGEVATLFRSRVLR